MKRIPLLPLLALAAVSAGAETLPLPRYTKLVEHIESSGTQWINTGFSPTNKNVRIEVTYRFVSLPTGTDRKYVFGESFNDGKVRLQYAVGDAGHCAIGFGNSFKGDVTFDSYDTNTTHTIVCSNGVFSLDGTTSNEWDLSDASLATTDTNHPIYLFGHNANNGNPSSYLSSIRLYSCKIWDNGVLVRDFMPALKDWTTPCLYDAVSGTFYENAGSGSFVAGPDVTAYRNATYIETDRTALINTEYVPTSKTEIEMKFAFTRLLEDKRYVFGGYGANSSGRFMFSYGPASTGCFLGYGSTFTNSAAGIPYNMGKHVMKYVRNEGFVFDGTVVDTAPVDLTKWAGTSKALYLCGLNSNGASANVDYIPPIRIYYCKIWEDGDLVRDLVPVQRVFDGKNGLHDNVTGNFYGYYGTRTDFTAFFAPAGLVIVVK